MFAGEIRSIFTNRNQMPSPTAPRTPGYRFKDGKLMIFHEDEVMLIQAGIREVASTSAACLNPSF